MRIYIATDFFTSLGTPSAPLCFRPKYVTQPLATSSTFRPRATVLVHSEYRYCLLFRTLLTIPDPSLVRADSVRHNLKTNMAFLPFPPSIAILGVEFSQRFQALHVF